MWKPFIIGTILATIIIFFLNSMMNSALAETNTVSSTVVTNNTPPTANAPSVNVNNSDICKSAASAGVQTQILGIASGITVTDENCERIKLSRSLYAMGMKVAAISTLCADYRVFDAMWNAGTYCPYDGSIGLDAKQGWVDNIDDIPKKSSIYKNIEEKQQAVIIQKEFEGVSNDWEVFFTLVAIMFLPVL
tara:strand:+ start:520 stop:1092 length:573 start_codon:yes stop_codon:yes gene_type:complete